MRPGGEIRADERRDSGLVPGEVGGREAITPLPASAGAKEGARVLPNPLESPAMRFDATSATRSRIRTRLASDASSRARSGEQGTPRTHARRSSSPARSAFKSA